MAQLPSFSIEKNTPLPITEKYVTDLCSRFLDKNTFSIFQSLSLEPPLDLIKTGSTLVDSWYTRERQLRLAIAQIRALKMKKKFTVSIDGMSPEVLQIARTATGFENPLDAEMYLAKARINSLESLRPLEEFSTDALFAYMLKLKLVIRLNKFNVDDGQNSYQKIYKTILGQSTGDNT
jgi:hypothetical protein